MRRRSLRTLALVAVAALTVAAPAAASAPALVVKHVDTSAWPEVTVTAQTPDPSTTPELQVFENGQAAANVRLATGADKTAVALAIDTSESMHGPKIADAIAAATTFVTGAQSTDSLGVFAFNSKPYLSVAFPANSTGAASGLAALATGDQPGTAIYGGVKMAAQALAAQPIKRRAIVLLTDGSSDHDSATRVPGHRGRQGGPRDHLLGRHRGLDIGPGGPAGRSRATRVASSCRRPIARPSSRPTRRSRPPSRARSPSRTTAWCRRAPRSTWRSTCRATARARRPSSAPGKAESASGSSSPLLHMPTSAVGRAAVAVGAAVLVLFGVLMLLSAKPGVGVGKRIAAYTEPKKRAIELPGVSPVKISMLHQLFVATEKIAGSFNYWKRMTFRLEQADLPLRTAEVVYIQMGAALILGVLGRFVFGLNGLLELLAAGGGHHDSVAVRQVHGAQAPEHVRDAAAGDADHPGRVAQGRPRLQLGARRASSRRAPSRPRRSSAASPRRSSSA